MLRIATYFADKTQVYEYLIDTYSSYVRYKCAPYSMNCTRAQSARPLHWPPLWQPQRHPMRIPLFRKPDGSRQIDVRQLVADIKSPRVWYDFPEPWQVMANDWTVVRPLGSMVIASAMYDEYCRANLMDLPSWLAHQCVQLATSHSYCEII